jgi:hypothetical protein
MFVNAAAGDLHLVAGATSVIDTVPAVASAAQDWDGDPRPQGAAADYGADEYPAGTLPPTKQPSANQPPTVAVTSPAVPATFNAPATINMAATATDPDGTIARVDFLAGGTVVGSDSTAPYSFNWTNVGAGTFSLAAVAYDNLGASTTSAAVAVTVSGSSGSVLPAPWSSRDIGSPALAGSAVSASGTFTVKGAGADIWGTSDQFQFVSQPMTGDGQIVVQVASLTNTNSWSKAGVMIRNTLAADSAHAFAIVTPANGVGFQRRLTAGGTSAHTGGSAVAAPYWVKLVRSGSLFSAYSSADGSAWALIGSSTIAMGNTVYAGLAVTSHTTSALATATFTGVVLAAGSSNQPPTVALTAPASGATFTAPAIVGLSASATDPDGSVAKVEFYTGTTLLGSDASSPFTFSWGNVAAGSYSVTAVAVDNSGARTTSAPVAVTVTSATTLSKTLMFTPSTDNSMNVTSYTLDIFTAGANPSTATPVKSQNVGKPPIVNGDMSVDVSQVIASLPPGSFFGTVTATGPGGSTRSAPSATFTK